MHRGGRWKQKHFPQIWKEERELKRCPLEHCEWRGAADRHCLWPGEWCPRREERLRGLWTRALAWTAGKPGSKGRKPLGSARRQSLRCGVPGREAGRFSCCRAALTSPGKPRTMAGEGDMPFPDKEADR